MASNQQTSVKRLRPIQDGDGSHQTSRQCQVKDRLDVAHRLVVGVGIETFNGMVVRSYMTCAHDGSGDHLHHKDTFTDILKPLQATRAVRSAGLSRYDTGNGR